MKTVGKIIATLLLIILTILLAFMLTPNDPDSQGRDMLGTLLNFFPILIILILVISLFICWKFRDGPQVLLFTVIAIEIIALLIISNISGFTGTRIFHLFNLQHLLGVNIVLVMPLLLGIGLFRLIKRIKKRH